MKGRPASAPSVPPISTKCSEQKTCDKCLAVKGASGSLCEYDPTNKVCVQLSSSTTGPSSLGLLVRTTEDCKPIKCGDGVYYPSVIRMAIDHGQLHINAPLKWNASPQKTNYYLHLFGNYEGLDMGICSKGLYQKYEFPILTSGQVYGGGNPATDRVVFDSNGDYCALITHTQANGNGFVSCVQQPI